MYKIKVQDLNHQYKNKKVFSNLNFNLKSTGFIALTGHSGSGKSTLLNILNGFIKPISGTVYLDTIEITQLNYEELRQMRLNHLSYVPQKNTLIGYLTAIENIELALEILNIELEDELMNKYINKLELEGLLHKPVTHLSGGERKRVEILRELMTHREVLMLDEPTSALDEETSMIILSILKEISKTKLVIISTHQFDMIEKLCDGIIRLDEGQLYFNDYITEETHIQKFESNKQSTLVPKFKTKTKPKLNFIKMFTMMLLFVLVTIVIAYRYQDRSWVNSNILQYSDPNKKGLLSINFDSPSSDQLDGILDMFPNLKVNEIYPSDVDVTFDYLYDKRMSSSRNIMRFNGEYELLSGTLPTYKNEILITRLHYDLFKIYGFKNELLQRESIHEYDDIIGKRFKITSEYYTYYEIVGIIDTNARYTSLDETTDYLDDILDTHHVFLYGHSQFDLYNPYTSVFFIDFFELSFTEIYALNRYLYNNNNYALKNEYMNKWQDTINQYIDSYVESYPYIVISTIVLMVIVVLLLNGYILNNELIINNRYLMVNLFLGKKKKKVIKEVMKQITYNYLIILTVTYIVNILVIHLINMNLENRFHVIFNLLKNNIYLYITPLILSLLILMGSYIQIVTRLSRKQIIAEFD